MKIKVSILVLITVIAALVGGLVGYVIFNSNKEVTIEKSQESGKNISTPIKNANVKYDAEKTITVNNKNYKISIYNEVVEESKQTVTFANKGEVQQISKLMKTHMYVNDKEIKTFDYTGIVEIEGENNPHDFNNDIELNTITDYNQKKYITIVFKQMTLASDQTYIIIINEKEEIVGTTIAMDDEALSIKSLGNEPLYSINEDGITLYRRCQLNKNETMYTAAKYKIMVNNSVMYTNIEEIYEKSDVEEIGK